MRLFPVVPNVMSALGLALALVACGGADKSDDEIRAANYAKHYGDPSDPNSPNGKARLAREAAAAEARSKQNALAIVDMNRLASEVEQATDVRLACKSLWFMCSGPASVDSVRQCERTVTGWDVDSEVRAARSKLAVDTDYWKLHQCATLATRFDTVDRAEILKRQAAAKAREAKRVAAEAAREERRQATEDAKEARRQAAEDAQADRDTHICMITDRLPGPSARECLGPRFCDDRCFTLEMIEKMDRYCAAHSSWQPCVDYLSDDGSN